VPLKNCKKKSKFEPDRVVATAKELLGTSGSVALRRVASSKVVDLLAAEEEAVGRQRGFGRAPAVEMQRCWPSNPSNLQNEPNAA
jgi:hypothetical protein